MIVIPLEAPRAHLVTISRVGLYEGGVRIEWEGFLGIYLQSHHQVFIVLKRCPLAPPLKNPSPSFFYR